MPKPDHSTERFRIGLIIKMIGSKPGITPHHLLVELRKSGIDISERTLATYVDLLKNEYKLLPQQLRLRAGYYLEGLLAIGEDELTTVVDSLWAFGMNLKDSQASNVCRRLGAARVSTLRQKNIYKPAKSQEDIEEKISLAIKDRLSVRMTVASPRSKSKEPVERHAFPLFKQFHERGWYIITRNADSAQYYATRVDRIIRFEIAADSHANEDYDEDIAMVQALMNAGWGMGFPHSKHELREQNNLPEIIVRFDEIAARYILEGTDRHPYGQIKPCTDGTGRVDYRIKLLYPDDFLVWVRSWGARAWFIAPQPVVDAERTELRRQLQNYGLEVAHSQ